MVSYIICTILFNIFEVYLDLVFVFGYVDSVLFQKMRNSAPYSITVNSVFSRVFRIELNMTDS